MESILSTLRHFDGVLELAPTPGDGNPEISWGDHFFYYAPSGDVSNRRQPYATIITKDYPDDSASRLDESGRWRVNAHVGVERVTELTRGRVLDPGDPAFAEPDVFLPHPLYGAYGWVAVVNPGVQTHDALLQLLQAAHDADRSRVERRRKGL